MGAPVPGFRSGDAQVRLPPLNPGYALFTGSAPLQPVRQFFVKIAQIKIAGRWLLLYIML